MADEQSSHQTRRVEIDGADILPWAEQGTEGVHATCERTSVPLFRKLSLIQMGQWLKIIVVRQSLWTLCQAGTKKGRWNNQRPFDFARGMAKLMKASLLCDFACSASKGH